MGAVGKLKFKFDCMARFDWLALGDVSDGLYHGELLPPERHSLTRDLTVCDEKSHKKFLARLDANLACGQGKYRRAPAAPASPGGRPIYGLVCAPESLERGAR